MIIRDNSARVPIQPESQAIKLLLHDEFVVVWSESLAEVRVRGKGDDRGDASGWSREEKMFSCASVDDVEEDTEDACRGQNQGEQMRRQLTGN